jgi:aspartyl protease family protein
MTKPTNPPKFNFFSLALIWIGLLLAATLVFDSALDKINNPNQQLRVVVSETGHRQIVLKQNRQGQYWANGEINGFPVEFLLDTGATYVAIPEHLADRLDLQRGLAQQTITANGTSLSYRTVLNTISLGDISLHNVPASISTGMEFDQVLLGMSFLKHLKLSQQGKLLTISVPE